MVWIVMTSSARSAGRQFGTYRNVAMVQLAQHYTARDCGCPRRECGFGHRVQAAKRRGLTRWGHQYRMVGRNNRDEERPPGSSPAAFQFGSSEPCQPAVHDTDEAEHTRIRIRTPITITTVRHGAEQHLPSGGCAPCPWHPPRGYWSQGNPFESGR